MIRCEYCGKNGLPSTSRLIMNGNREISPLCTACANSFGIREFETHNIEESGIERRAREERIEFSKIAYPRFYNPKHWYYIYPPSRTE